MGEEEGKVWSDSTELGMGHRGNGNSLPVTGMGAKPGKLGEHMGEGMTSVFS